MNETQKLLYHLKQEQTYELKSRFTPQVAEFVEQSRDLALIAWGCVNGGKPGQELLEVLFEQISDATNTVELLKPKRRKQ